MRKRLTSFPSATASRRADVATEAEYTYRYPLFYKLKDAGYDVNFIGRCALD
jgi:hypothetical protein